MADILPFRALRYDLQRVAASQVVTQPYDKITPAMQQQYYEASPYNLVRIILGRREADDNTTNNVYTRAAGNARQWRKEGILRQDSLPSVYTCSQAFTAPSGARFERRGFIALGRVEDYAAKVVFRHEQTLAKPKADRLDLMRATRVHYEQLFLLYEDPGEIDGLLSSGPAAKPTIEVADEYGVAHRVWQISDPAVIKSVQDRMRDKKLVIADGHHRYETALNFRDECRAAAPADAQAPYEFVMMTFVNMNDPGLLVLPTHRLVHFPSMSFRVPPAISLRLKKSIPRLTPRAPPRFCASAAAPGPRCWPSLRTGLSCCTRPSLPGQNSWTGSPSSSNPSMSCDCTNACWKEY
jgi:uncharacterized protein (DUF1015 family)